MPACSPIVFFLIERFVAGATDQPHGANGRIYTFKLANGGCGGAKLVLKVCINMDSQVPPEQQFEPEYKLLLDSDRLPPHRNIMSVFSHFIDESSAATLPNWDLNGDWIQKRTSFIVMPFFPRDLKHAMQSEKNAGNRIPAERARRITCDLLRAVEHLQAHRIAHCDLKPDNVLLQNVKTDAEVAVLTDFGCSKDFAGYDGMTMPHPPGFMKCGSVMALSTDLHKQVPGPGQVLDYSANDQFAVGLVAHEIMAGEPDHPFPNTADDGHPRSFKDEEYIDVEPEIYDEALRTTVQQLLRTDPTERMTASAALAELQKPLPVEQPAGAAAAAAAADAWGEWPGALQAEWDPLYEGVKMACLFVDAIEFVEVRDALFFFFPPQLPLCKQKIVCQDMLGTDTRRIQTEKRFLHTGPPRE